MINWCNRLADPVLAHFLSFLWSSHCHKVWFRSIISTLRSLLLQEQQQWKNVLIGREVHPIIAGQIFLPLLANPGWSKYLVALCELGNKVWDCIEATEGHKRVALLRPMFVLTALLLATSQLCKGHGRAHRTTLCFLYAFLHHNLQTKHCGFLCSG